MKIVWSWLKEYLPDLKASVEEVGAVLNLSSFEVESVEKVGGIKDVVVGEILECKKHLNADKLSVCKVSVVEVQPRQKEVEPLQIVCGASNVAKGQKVPVALVGAVLPGGFKIEEREIRGVNSFGMICSEKELGLAEESKGIMVLPAKAKVGSAFAGGKEDWVLDFNVLPNRPDALGHIGIAREAAALFNTTLQTPKVSEVRPREPKEVSPLKIRVETKELCKRYVGILISGVKIAPSPDWMQERLTAAGVRPISNIVDITNYVMLEYGQPLHAFDAEKVSGKSITVRQAREGETLKTIDEVQRKLTKNTLVIADAKKPIAVAGVMGGAESEISGKAKDIILESANFDAVSIRKTSKALGLRSESSMRFERGLDPETTLLAAQRAVQLIKEIAGGKIVATTDVKNFKIQPVKIRISEEQIASFLGIETDFLSYLGILSNLGFSIEKGKNDAVVIPPSFRQDITERADVMEEISRIYGYDKVPATLPAGAFVPAVLPKLQKAQNTVEQVMRAGGFQQLLSFSFMSANDIERFGLDKSRIVEIANPLSSEYQFMRTSMLPAILRAVEENQVEDTLQLFSIEKVYEKRKEGYSEPWVLAGSVVGQGIAALKYPKSQDFYIAKGVIENLMKELDIEIAFKEKTEANYAKGRTAGIWAKGDEIGIIGEIESHLLSKLNIEKPVAVFEIGLEALADLLSEKEYKRVSKFPEARFDFSMLADKSTSNDQIVHAAESASDLIEKFELFDYYEGKGIPEGKKSIAYHVVLQAADHTLSEEEVKGAREAILGVLKKIGVELRS